jgi:N-acetylmuramic acid 6-phosphate etherase
VIEPGSPAPTEGTNVRTRDLDLRGAKDVVGLLTREHGDAVDAVGRATVQIAGAVEAIVARLQAGGALHYVGAGTSGRLAALDAAECPPTFGTPSSLVVAHIAGGAAALQNAVEGAEDDAAAGSAEMRAQVTGRDAVVGISASGGAPYVVEALREARALGALTIALTSAPGSPLEAAAELAIVVETGPEAIAGSTRLKAGTAQKVVLNALSTASMIALGRVYDNLMIDVVATNDKLLGRALGLVRSLTGVDDSRARALLEAAGGSVKAAVVIERCGVTEPEARALLRRSGGFLRPVIKG